VGSPFIMNIDLKTSIIEWVSLNGPTTPDLIAEWINKSPAVVRRNVLTLISLGILRMNNDWKVYKSED